MAYPLVVGSVQEQRNSPRMAASCAILPMVTSLARQGVSCNGELHHHYSAPNLSRLGVFICGFRTPCGLPGRSACAARLAKGDTAPGLPLCRPIFSRNLRQLLRCGTRRRRCSSTTYACADECLNVDWFETLEQARALIEAWRRHYIESRPHMDLGGRSPEDSAGDVAAARAVCWSRSSRTTIGVRCRVSTSISAFRNAPECPS
jgi:hypothetical protein